MQVIKFDDHAETEWIQWLADRVDGRSLDDIIRKLRSDRFEIVQGWTEERLARSLFELAEAEEALDEYGFGVTTHLPQGFLEKCLAYCGSLEVVYPDCLNIVFEAIALEHYVEEIYKFSYEDIHSLVARQGDTTVRLQLDHEVRKWLTHIVEEAIKAYTSPIAISIYGEGGHCL